MYLYLYPNKEKGWFLYSLGTKPYYSITQVPLHLYGHYPNIKGHQRLTLRLVSIPLHHNSYWALQSMLSKRSTGFVHQACSAVSTRLCGMLGERSGLSHTIGVAFISWDAWLNPSRPVHICLQINVYFTLPVLYIHDKAQQTLLGRRSSRAWQDLLSKHARPCTLWD